MSSTLHSGDTFTVRGYTFRFTVHRDDDMGEPWKEYDGHGPVSDWTHRDKRPGEKVLIEDRGSKRFYDVQAAIRIAKRDQWGCPHGRHEHPNGPEAPAVYIPGHPTRGEVANCAVAHDYQRLRAWCTDQWEWYYVKVRLVDTPEVETLGGLESDDTEYLTTVAHELADAILTRVEVAHPDVQLSEN